MKPFISGLIGCIETRSIYMVSDLRRTTLATLEMNGRPETGLKFLESFFGSDAFILSGVTIAF